MRSCVTLIAILIFRRRCCKRPRRHHHLSFLSTRYYLLKAAVPAAGSGYFVAPSFALHMGGSATQDETSPARHQGLLYVFSAERTDGCFALAFPTTSVNNGTPGRGEERESARLTRMLLRWAENGLALAHLVVRASRSRRLVGLPRWAGTHMKIPANTRSKMSGVVPKIQKMAVTTSAFITASIEISAL